MTNKNLESLFNLPESSQFKEDDLVPQEAQETQDAQEAQDLVFKQDNALSNLEKIDQAMPAVRDLEKSDQEMDELANLAKDGFKDLIDVAQQTEARFSAELFNAASSMLGHAISAKNAKLNRKLKLIELQLKKAKLDLDNPNEATTTSSGSVLDRNELLAEVLKQAKTDK